MKKDYIVYVRNKETRIKHLLNIAAETRTEAALIAIKTVPIKEDKIGDIEVFDVNNRPYTFYSPSKVFERISYARLKKIMEMLRDNTLYI